MLSFKKHIQEVAEPKAGDEKRFKDKHVVDAIDDPHNDKETRDGIKKSPAKKKRLADMDQAEAEKVYEEIERRSDVKMVKVKLPDGSVVMRKERPKIKIGKGYNEQVIYEMSDAQMKERERIVKGMKKNQADLKDRYGNQWRSVMYATAAKQAMDEQAHIIESLAAAQSAVGKKDPDAFHISSHGTQHVFGGGDSDRENHTYHVHDTKTGKTHHVSLDHGGEAMSHGEVKKQAGQHVSPAAVKSIHKDHKEELGESTIVESLAAAQSAVGKKDPDSFHISSHGSQHVFGGGDSDRENHTYHVHDTKTGKTHHVSLDHGGQAMSHGEVKKAAGQHVSPAAVKSIHKDHKEELGESVQIDEISTKTLSNYMRKSSADAGKPGASARRQDKRIGGQSMADNKIRKKEGKYSTAKVAASEETDLDEAFKVGAMKLKDGSSVKLAKEDVQALDNLYKNLNSSNRKKMQEKLEADKKSFGEILAFAKQAM